MREKHTSGTKLKTKNYKEKENLKERGTKRFQERKAEEKEAEEEVKKYIYRKTKDDFTTQDRHPASQILHKE